MDIEKNLTKPAPCYLFLSAHDYRTPRKANIHFLADQFKLRGSVRFFSLRYSNLSKYKNDIRVGLDDKANVAEMHSGVECFLWKTVIHPFNTRKPWLRFFEDILFRYYVGSPSPTLIQWIKDADVIFFESGIAVVFIALAEKLNPDAKKIYRASDDLDTINVANYVHRTFARSASDLDAICLISRHQAKKIPSKNNIYLVPHGVDENLHEKGDPSPYGEGVHAVSVGSMLFDRSFFEYASHAFPDITFHVIGSGEGRSAGYGDNVIVYGEMPYEETLAYIKHADLGIAAYKSNNVPAYLADSSMKLLQYDYFMLPAICSAGLVGDFPSRFGYIPSNNESIHSAILAALSGPRLRFRKYITWNEVADRLVAPISFDDTIL